MLIVIRESKVWRTLNAEEKEAYILSHIKSGLGRATADEFHDTLGHLYCQQTLNKSNGFSRLREVTPDWVKKLSAYRYKKYFKPDGHRVRNYTECQGVRDCRLAERDLTGADPVITSILDEFPPKTSVNPDENCEETDAKFNWAEKAKTLNTRHSAPYEPSCSQIASIIIIEEDQDVLVLCKMYFCRGGACQDSEDDVPDGGEKTFEDNIYGVYYLSPNPGIPVAQLNEWSAGYFECDLMKYNLGGAKEENGDSIQPEMIRVPESSSIVIKNCIKALYYSPDMGKTILSFVFYSKKFEHGGFKNGGSADPSYPDPTQVSEVLRDGYQELGESEINNETKWIRTYRLDQLTVPPMIAASAEGHRILL